MRDSVMVIDQDTSVEELQMVRKAIDLVARLRRGACVIVDEEKFRGVGKSMDAIEAYKVACVMQPKGTIACFNMVVESVCAQEIANPEITEEKENLIKAVIAPGFTTTAKNFFRRKNITHIENSVIDLYSSIPEPAFAEIVTERPPSEQELKAFRFAFRIFYYVDPDPAIFVTHEQLLKIVDDDFQFELDRNLLRIGSKDIIAAAETLDEQTIRKAVDVGASAAMQMSWPVKDAVVDIADKNHVSIISMAKKRFKYY